MEATEDRECGNCSHWWPKSILPLELKGQCFLDPDKPIFKTRYEGCKNFEGNVLGEE